MTDKTSTVTPKASAAHHVGDVVVHQGKPFRVVGMMRCHVTSRTKWMLHSTDIKSAVRESDCLWCDEAAIQTVEQAKAALDAIPKA